eukprot:6191608-Pleurochrysis_carterae.AAC.1
MRARGSTRTFSRRFVGSTPCERKATRAAHSHAYARAKVHARTKNRARARSGCANSRKQRHASQRSHACSSKRVRKGVGKAADANSTTSVV